MLNVFEIEKLVKNQLTVLASDQRLAQAIRSYQLGGGEEAPEPWRILGLYAYEAEQQRLVLETLYLGLSDTCIVRVFREGTVEMLYARKAVGDMEKLSVLIHEAGAAFLLHLQDPLALDSIEGNYDLLVKHLGPDVLQALLPIPPPVDLEELEK